MAAFAAPWRTLPYSRLHDALSSVKPLEGARFFHLDRRIETSAPDMTVADVRMVIATASGDLEVGIGEDGALDFPMSEALLDEDPPVRVNVPAGKLAISVQIDTTIPAEQEFPYALVTDVDAEYRRFVKQQGMLARMMAPDMEGLAVRFAEGETGTATVSAPAGATLQPGPDGRIVIPIEKGWKGSQVTLSRAPESIEPVFED